MNHRRTHITAGKDFTLAKVTGSQGPITLRHKLLGIGVTGVSGVFRRAGSDFVPVSEAEHA